MRILPPFPLTPRAFVAVVVLASLIGGALSVVFSLPAQGHDFAERDDVSTASLSRVYAAQFDAAMDTCATGKKLPISPLSTDAIDLWFAGKVSNAALIAVLNKDNPIFGVFTHCVIDTFHASFPVGRDG